MMTTTLSEVAGAVAPATRLPPGLKLLIVEDNAALSEMICAHLREIGFAADAATAGAQAIATAAATPYDAVILDLGLPDIDGMEVLRVLRQRGIPTLILTARDGIHHRVAGLDAGADDYILKPFDLAEFDARLRAVLRRAGHRTASMVGFGDLTLDRLSRSVNTGVSAGGVTGGRAGVEPVELTAREAALLELLIQQGDRIVVRDVLADRLFGPGEDMSANALEAIVSRLRRKLAQTASAIQIDTVRGIGYRLRQP